MPVEAARPRSTTAAGNAAGLGAALTLLAAEAEAVSAVVPDTFVIPPGGATNVTDAGGNTFFAFTPDCDALFTCFTVCEALTFCGFVGGCSADLDFYQGDTADTVFINVSSCDIPVLGDGAFIGCGTSFGGSGNLDLLSTAPDDPFYVGFVFNPESSPDNLFGYVQLSYNLSDGVTVYGWAYESSSVFGITTSPIPEPGTVTLMTGLIALGGAVAYRRLRSRSKPVAPA